VVLYPIAVQGARAAESIVHGIAWFNAQQGGNRPDVLILARGGGSFEDLLPFSDERVVRAVAASGIPLISAIGHEPDMPLCDYAADYRAPTPTRAAEHAVPLRGEILEGLRQAAAGLFEAMESRVLETRQRLDMAVRLLPDPLRAAAEARRQLAEGFRRLAWLGPLGAFNAKERLEALERVLLAHNPEAPLARGFALVTDKAGHAVNSAATEAREIRLRFADGEREGVLT
jgi:exodeoxyribonuclease VII large subunit